MRTVFARGRPWDSVKIVSDSLNIWEEGTGEIGRCWRKKNWIMQAADSEQEQ